MNRADAHALLDAAIAGAKVTERQITEALRATGDLAKCHAQKAGLRAGARAVLDAHQAGDHCDEEAIAWALQVLRANSAPVAPLEPQEAA